MINKRTDLIRWWDRRLEIAAVPEAVAELNINNLETDVDRLYHLLPKTKTAGGFWDCWIPEPEVVDLTAPPEPTKRWRLLTVPKPDGNI